jgi:hypothetical protein
LDLFAITLDLNSDRGLRLRYRRRPVLASERIQLLKCVRSVRGVREVRDELDAHAPAARVSALQAGVPRNARHAESMQAHWAPGLRLLALAGGTALALYGASRRGLPGLLAGAAGVGLAVRAAYNEGLRQTVDRVASRHDIEIRKTIHITVTPQQVPAAVQARQPPALHVVRR